VTIKEHEIEILAIDFTPSKALIENLGWIMNVTMHTWE
jgi:hypothetical protein